VVGGGNSAGQAALHFSRYARRVHLLVLGDRLTRDMSRYLVDRIERTPGIQVHLETEVVSVEGEGHLTAVAVRRLAEAGIKTNVTLCFSSVQCLIAAKAGAAYVSPFIGRLDDVGQEGMDVIREARVIFDNYQIGTEILAASIRHPRHVVEAAMIGADVATLPPDVLKKLLLHPLTDRGLEQFLADWSTLAARAKASV